MGAWVRIVVLCLMLYYILYSVSGQPIKFSLNFESGDLEGWTKERVSYDNITSYFPYPNAFDSQPTYGDNPTARNRGQPSQHQGSYWIGTYEKYQGLPGQREGDIQGDEPQGLLISSNFTIPKGTLSFLIGGGSAPETGVLLQYYSPAENVWDTALSASGSDTETMRKETWDLDRYAGLTGRIVIADLSSGAWGHINADDFRFRVSVPDVVGLRLVKAREALENRQFSADEVEEATSHMEPGLVISQYPQAGELYDLGETVVLTVSIEEIVDVPNVIGLSRDEASDVLREVGLVFREQEEATSSVENGTVVEQNPVGRSKLKAGSTVVLTVAVNARELVEVPNVVGMDAADARRILEQTRLLVVENKTAGMELQANRVIRQYPEPGSLVDAGTAVTLIMAFGNQGQPPDEGDEDRGGGKIPVEALALGLAVGGVMIGVGIYFFSRMKPPGPGKDGRAGRGQEEKGAGSTSPRQNITLKRDDSGVQDVDQDASPGLSWDIDLLPVKDPGDQTVSWEGPRIEDEWEGKR